MRSPLVERGLFDLLARQQVADEQRSAPTGRTGHLEIESSIDRIVNAVGAIPRDRIYEAREKGHERCAIYQSLITMPSNPHSFRKISWRSMGLSAQCTPLILP